MKKIALAILFLLILNSCDYEPIYSSKNAKFAILNIESTGDKKINKILVKKLEIYNYNKNISAKKKYNLNISSSVSKNISSKDKKGNPIAFNLTISFKLEIEDSLGEKKYKVFEQNTIYDNDTNKFNLRKYENLIKENIVENINENIIQYLQNIN
jgi:hypothetical protein